MTYAIAVGPALIIGFVTGLFAFRQKSRWCPTCGATFTCPDRSGHADMTPGESHANPPPVIRGTHFPDRRHIRDGEG